MNEYLEKYPTGLLPAIMEKRKENRQRILTVLNATEDDWNNWKWQFDNVFKDRRGFEIIKQVIKLKPEEAKKTLALFEEMAQMASEMESEE